MHNKIYNILEVANVHGGSLESMLNLLKEFEVFHGDFGIKFQPFRYDRIALADYKWYPVYKELFFNPDEWSQIISEASKTKDIWIDVFDSYSFEITSQHLQKIRGIKFQASVLANSKLLQLFSTIDLSDKVVMLNISGFENDKIAKICEEFEHALRPREIILQIGFQSYPTKLEDSGLIKIQALKSAFPYRIAFADHIDGNHEDAKILPVIASLKGAEIIEKHIRQFGPTPKYDFYSACDHKQYADYLEMLKRYASTEDQPFITSSESNYLVTTLQIPILNRDLSAGSIPDIVNDLEYKRTNSNGLNSEELKQLISDFYVLSRDKKAGDVFYKEDFRKANIASIIACRLKSSRLPRKALLNIGNLPSVEYCLRSALAFYNVNNTVLATSDTEEDAELVNHTYNDSVIFFQGHPMDVMKRYIDAIDRYRFDVIVRITADMPFVSNEILEILLRSHFENGADYTRAREAAVGTNLEIMNAEALRRMKKHFPSADYSEYMTYYFINNKDYFKINEVTLPENLVRDYRLTLDYPEDLEMFNRIDEYLLKNNLKPTLINIFAYLDNNPEVAEINSRMELIYKTSKELIETLNKFTRIEADA